MSSKEPTPNSANKSTNAWSNRAKTVKGAGAVSFGVESVSTKRIKMQ